MAASEDVATIRSLIAEVANFPEPGIGFKDITALLAHPEGMRTATRALRAQLDAYSFDGLVAIESRGFIFAAPLAAALGVPLLLARKPGKLPRMVGRREYTLEYGSDAIEIHREDVQVGARYVLIDDLIATGGTAVATIGLLEDLGAQVIAAVFLIKLGFLDGARRLNVPVEAIVSYD